jgi:hypothetical protein
MKIFATVALLFTLIYQANADCGASGIYVWPKGETISSSPVIMVDGYYMSQDQIRKIGKEIRATLTSASGNVNLKVVQLNKGQMHLTQVILEPEQELKQGVKYTLRLVSIEKDGTKKGLSDAETGKLINIWGHKGWTVSGTKDELAPVWKKKLQFKSNSYVSMGCGPSVDSSFAATVTDESQYVYHVKLTSDLDELKPAAEYYVVPGKEDLLNIGHGMCSGAFVMKEGLTHYAEVRIMDASGNYSDVVKVTFVSPTTEDSQW